MQINECLFLIKKIGLVTEILDVQINQALFPFSAILTHISISGQAFCPMPLTQGLVLARRPDKFRTFSFSERERGTSFCGEIPF